MRRSVRALLSLLLLTSAVLLALPASSVAAVSGQWKVDCTYVKSAMDDPILHPNQPGASHLHDFFGNISTDAYSTYDSMKGVTSTCAHNDRSAYWTPALYRDGVKINPSWFIAYYENRAPADATIEAYPAGFKLVFGNSTATSASEVDDHIVWGCSDNTQIGGKAPPASCGSGAIQLRLMWPYCWDGRSTGGDMTGHVSFAPGGVCPAAYPHVLPTLRTNIGYQVGTSTGDVTLASGSVYSVHADFFNAWDQATLQELVDTCLNGKKDCGHFTGTSPGTAPSPTPSATPSAAIARAAATSSSSAHTAVGHGIEPPGEPPVPPDFKPAGNAVADPPRHADQSGMLSVAAALGALFLVTGGALVLRRRRRAG